MSCRWFDWEIRDIKMIIWISLSSLHIVIIHPLDYPWSLGPLTLPTSKNFVPGPTGRAWMRWWHRPVELPRSVLRRCPQSDVKKGRRVDSWKMTMTTVTTRTRYMQHTGKAFCGAFIEYFCGNVNQDISRLLLILIDRSPFERVGGVFLPLKTTAVPQTTMPEKRRSNPIQVSLAQI